MITSLLSARKLFAAIMSCAVVFSGANAQLPTAQPQKRHTVAKARDSYYNLRRLGLLEFRAQVQPNWDLLLTGIDHKTVIMNQLAGLHFVVSIDSESVFRLTPSFDQRLTDPKRAEALGRVTTGTDAAVKQFFSTWSLFMLTSPFPPVGSEHEVSEAGGQYKFSHKEGNSDVITITDKDFRIIEMKVLGANHNGWFKPVLEKTPEGFILKSFEASHVAQNGRQNSSLRTTLEYTELNGLKLLKKVHVDTVHNGVPVQIEWIFTDYQLKVR